MCISYFKTYESSFISTSSSNDIELSFHRPNCLIIQHFDQALFVYGVIFSLFFMHIINSMLKVMKNCNRAWNHFLHMFYFYLKKKNDFLFLLSLGLYRYCYLIWLSGNYVMKLNSTFYVKDFFFLSWTSVDIFLVFIDTK